MSVYLGQSRPSIRQQVHVLLMLFIQVRLPDMRLCWMMANVAHGHRVNPLRPLDGRELVSSTCHSVCKKDAPWFIYRASCIYHIVYSQMPNEYTLFSCYSVCAKQG